VCLTFHACTLISGRAAACRRSLRARGLAGGAEKLVAERRRAVGVIERLQPGLDGVLPCAPRSASRRVHISMRNAQVLPAIGLLSDGPWRRRWIDMPVQNARYVTATTGTPTASAFPLGVSARQPGIGRPRRDMAQMGDEE
jgi:hypothetical protein